MKKIYYFIAAACMMAFASCSSDIKDFEAENFSSVKDGTLTVGVGMPEGSDTRVNTADLLNMVWEEGDQIRAIGYNGDMPFSKVLGTSYLTLKSGANSAKAVFEGDAVAGATHYKYVYTGANASFNYFQNRFSCNYMEQVQEGRSSAHIKNCLSLYTDKFCDANASGTSATLSPQMVVLRLNIKNLPAAIKDAKEFQIKNYIKNANRVMDVAAVTYKGTIEADKDNFIYMAFDRTTSIDSGDDYFVIEIKVKDIITTAMVKAKAENGKYFDNGTVQTATIDYLNKGAWQWTEPEVMSKPIYTPDFEKNDGWVQETTPDFLKDMWSFSHWDGYPVIDFYAMNAAGKTTDPIDSRMISPVVSLKENNELSFNYNLDGYENMDKLRAGFNVSIRATDGDGTWEVIPGLNYPKYMSRDAKSGALAIPAKYNNKDVQFSFFIHSERFPNVFTGGVSPGAVFRASDFKVIYR